MQKAKAVRLLKWMQLLSKLLLLIYSWYKITLVLLLVTTVVQGKIRWINDVETVQLSKWFHRIMFPFLKISTLLNELRSLVAFKLFQVCKLWNVFLETLNWRRKTMTASPI
jgi:hypothetical protein